MSKNNRYKASLLLMASWLFIGTLVAQTSVPKQQKYKNKLDRKIILSPYFGVALLPASQKVDEYGYSRNIYAKFRPSYMVGCGINYPIPYVPNLFASGDLSIIGGGLSAFFSDKAYYRLLIVNSSIGPKYIFRDKNKKLRPYVMGGISLPVVNFLQKAHLEEFTPDPGAATNIDFGTATKFEKRVQEVQVTFGPLISPFIGGGVQFKLDRKYSLFLQANINFASGQNKKVKQNFPANETPFQLVTFRAGVNIQLMKPKPPIIDTNMIPIPDMIASLNVPEDFMKQSMLVREGVFDVVLREGLKHNVRVSLDHELIIEEDPQDPCKVVCYLYDDKGEIISRAESTPEGKIIFSDLKKGIYDISFVLEKPCKQADFKYKFPDPNVEVLLQYNSEGGINDTLIYNIEGKVYLSDTSSLNFIYRSSPLFLKSQKKESNTNYDITVMLADSTRKVIGRIEPEKAEKFRFKKLKGINFDVIYKAPDSEISTKIDYTYFDNYHLPAKHILMEQKVDSVAIEQSGEDKFYQKLKYNIKGKVTIKDSITKFNQVTLFLVNPKKRVVYSKKPEKDGTFIFKNLKSKVNYEIYYETEEPKSNILVAYKLEEIVPMPQANLTDIDIIGRRKRLVPDLPTSENLTNYSVNGSLVNPDGLGVFVGAFENINNVDLLCKKLIRDGYKDIAIQVSMTGNLNKEYEFTRDFKIHKVIVGTYSKEREAKRTQAKLEKLGYDTYVVNHSIVKKK